MSLSYLFVCRFFQPRNHHHRIFHRTKKTEKKNESHHIAWTSSNLCQPFVSLNSHCSPSGTLEFPKRFLKKNRRKKTNLQLAIIIKKKSSYIVVGRIGDKGVGVRHLSRGRMELKRLFRTNKYKQKMLISA